MKSKSLINFTHLTENPQVLFTARSKMSSKQAKIKDSTTNFVFAAYATFSTNLYKTRN